MFSNYCYWYKTNKSVQPFGRQPDNVLNPFFTHYLLALVDNLAVVLLESLVFFFCWVAEGFLSSCSSGSGAAGSRWSASELPLLVLGLSSSDLCRSLDILVKLFLGKLLKRKGGNKGNVSLRNKPTAFSSLNLHLKSYFNENASKVFTHLIVQEGYRGGDVSHNGSVQGFTELKLENPLTFFSIPWTIYQLSTFSEGKKQICQGT